MKILFYLFLLFLVAACIGDIVKEKPFYRAENASVFEEKVRFEETTEIAFPLATSVQLDASILQFLQHGNKNFLFIFNPYTLKLHIYDFDQRQEIRWLMFQREGPDGVGANTDLMGFFAISMDTFLIHNYSERKIKIFDNQARRLLTVDLPAPDESHFSIIIGHSAPFKKGNDVYFSNLYQGTMGQALVGVEQVPALMRLNAKNFQYDFLGSRSKVYEMGYNVAGDNSYTFATYNPHERKIIYSFRQDHFLYSNDDKGNVEKHYVGSKYFRELSPLSMDFSDGMNRESMGDPSVALYVRTAPRYDKLLYDNVNHLYYRFTYLPRTREEYEAGKFAYRRSVIMFNESFEKVGEWVAPPSKYNLYLSFAAAGGLLLAKENDKDEDSLIFGLLKPVPL